MTGKFAAVVGAVIVDIWGRSFRALAHRDSNPGEVRFSLGGVGRNIAHNMRLLGIDVQLLTALGGDAWARQIEDNCRETGIGLDRALRLPGQRTSTYLSISGPDGDMELAVCDTDIARYITPELIEDSLDMLNAAGLVVFDGNLTPEAIDCLSAKCTAPLFVDPVSAAKAVRLIPFLDRIHTIKPNAIEAEALTGKSRPEDAAAALLRSGVKRVFVTDGANGMAAAQGTDIIRVPCCPAKLVNATGGGDAAMAALCRSFLDGRGLSESARYALAAGALAVECEQTINPALCDALVKHRSSFLERKSKTLYQ